METVNPGLALALVLVAAMVGGTVARLLRVPKVVGYLLAGALWRYVMGSYATSVDEAPGVAGRISGGVDVVSGAVQPLALALILFTMGSALDPGHLRGAGRRLWARSAADILCVLVAVTIGCGMAAYWSASGGISTGLTFGLLLGAAAVATAPAATLMVLREYDAKGPASERISALTAANNTASIVLFHTFLLLLSAAGLLESVGTSDRLLWLVLLCSTAGSVMLGALVGLGLSVVYAKVSATEFVLILLAVLVGLGAGSDYLSEELHLSFSFLLTSLACGAVFANITMDLAPLHGALRTLGVPVFAAFFVLAGYGLHVSDLGHIGSVGIVYVVLRLSGKVLGGIVGARWAGAADRNSRMTGTALLCQAGVAIGLADLVCRTWTISSPDGIVPDPRAIQFKTIVLGSVVVFEMLGPIALKAFVVRSGEVKALTLLRRHQTAVIEGESVVRLTVHSFLRLLGLARFVGTKDTEGLQVRHIMRSNIKLLSASAGLDEVLHFVEGSRFNHFPVVDGNGGFAGMIRFADLREIIYDPSMRELVTAIDLANPSSPTVPQDMPLDQLLEVFSKTDLESLTVLEEEGKQRVVGLVEQRDLLRTLHMEAGKD